jgi:flavin reductase (DIM6/NTAB) family NADH-FMN oxidoreductase RutF
MTIETDFFRKVMGQFATGVTIATTRSQAGLAGLTVNSFTSVSLHPLLVLICVDLHSQALPFFRESGVFAVNILTQEQEALSKCFASSSEERYAYFCHAKHYRAATGAPILEGSLGFIDARITSEYPGGDHTIFLGKVEAMGYEGHISFLPSANHEQSTLPELASPVSSNGHREMPSAGEQQKPLLYYHGQYSRLSNKPLHTHPKVASTQKQRQKPQA